MDIEDHFVFPGRKSATIVLSVEEPVANGTNGDDIIRGTRKHDTISTNGGERVVVARLGDDIINCGNEADRMSGAGNDRIHLGAGNNMAQGEGGDDSMVGGTDTGRVRETKKDNLILNRMGDELFGNGGTYTFEYVSGDDVDFIFDVLPNDSNQVRLFGVDLPDVDIIEIQIKYRPHAGLVIDADDHGVFEGTIIYQNMQIPNELQGWIDDGAILFMV